MTLHERLLTASFCVVLLTVPAMRAQSSAADRLLHDMRLASNLDADDKVPYHVKVSYDLYDLKGHKKSTGTLERWSWPGAGHSRLIVSGATYQSPGPEGQPPKANREAYLVRILNRFITNPAPAVPQKGPAYAVQGRTIAGNNYTCLTPLRRIEGAQPRYAPEDEEFANDQEVVATRQWCSPEDSSIVRVAFDDNNFVALRNKIASFNGVSYSQEVTLQYAGVVAMVGHVDLLEAYTPTEAELTPVKPAAKPSLPPGIPAGVLAGKIIKKVPPTYPQSAKSSHIGGTVVLAAIISKQGTISSLDVIASPDKSLSEAATDAVKHWTYQPYLLNGQPNEVDTQITVNFNLNGPA